MTHPWPFAIATLRGLRVICVHKTLMAAVMGCHQSENGKRKVEVKGDGQILTDKTLWF